MDRKEQVRNRITVATLDAILGEQVHVQSGHAQSDRFGRSNGLLLRLDASYMVDVEDGVIQFSADMVTQILVDPVGGYHSIRLAPTKGR